MSSHNYGIWDGENEAKMTKKAKLDTYKNRVQPDPYDTEVREVKLATNEESKANILKQYSNYIANLAVFHLDAMELLRHIDYHWVGTDNRLDTKAKIKDLIKQGKEMEF